MSRWTGVVVLAVVAALPGCKKKEAPASDPAPVAEMKAIKDPAVREEPIKPPPVAVVAEPDLPELLEPEPTPPPSTGSRDVPGERGVPLDRAVLGAFAHPFGALEAVKPGSSREDILAALPNAQRDGEEHIRVPIGVEDLFAQIDIDYNGHLDVVRIKVPATARDLLTKAWGKPSAAGTWFDRKQHWRADLDEDNELMIGPFTPLAELLGKGPDGLAETKGVIGATAEELTARFGARVREVDADQGALVRPGAKRFDLLLPTTEHCKFWTMAELELSAGRVSALRLAQCYGDDAGRRAALASIESKWGRAVAGRGADDRPVFTFNVPGRRVEMTLDEHHESHPGWQIVITAK